MLTDTLTPVIDEAGCETVPDEFPDASYLEQDGFEERLAEYQAGEFGYVGVRAFAQLKFETPQGGWIFGPRVTTPGLWGIEDDSGNEYLQEIGAEELSQLRDMLQALNVAADEIDRAL